MDAIIHGLCPTCYLTVTSEHDYVAVIGSGEGIYYHKDCEPTRMKFIKKNKDKWAQDGHSFRTTREDKGFSIKEVANYLQISVSKLRKFESGQPVTHAKLLSMALNLFYEINELTKSKEI